MSGLTSDDTRAQSGSEQMRNPADSTLDELRARLTEAQAAQNMLFERGRSSRVPLPEYMAAHERVLAAEREVAAASGDQYVLPLDLGFKPEAGVSAPVLLQTDTTTVLTFNAVKIAADGSRSAAGTAIIEFDLGCWTTLGYPNDEALPGHPLYGRGLSAYGIFEVHNSHWLRRMYEQKKVSFPNTKPWVERHLLFSFHDSTFECICRGIKSCSLSPKPFAEIFSDVSKRVLSQHNPE
jgi:hypothetical protein